MNNNSTNIILLPWKTKYFIATFISYIILFLLGCSCIILSAITITHTTNLGNHLISGISVIFGISIILISGYWYSYNNQKIFSLKQVKRKSILLDAVLTSYIFTLYALMLYITYVSFGINIVFNNTSLINSVIWCCVITGIVQIGVYFLNTITMNKQRYGKKMIAGDKTIFQHKWWTNLVYSYWLDKIYFSVKELNSIESNGIFMVDQNDLNSHFRANEMYLKTFKYLNIFKRLVQNSFSAIMTTLMSVAVMLIAPIAYWLHKLPPDADFGSFIVIFWIVISAISLIYYHFIITNKFQLIKDDNEKHISNNYRSIKIMFKQFIQNNVEAYNIPEAEKLRWLAIIRKYLMYYQPTIEDKINIAIFDSESDDTRWAMLRLTALKKDILYIDFIKM